MINLQEICNQDIAVLASNHFDTLNPTDVNGYLLGSSLIMKLINYQESLEDQDEVDVIDFLLGTNFDQIYKIISGDPQILNSIINDFEAGYDVNIISQDKGRTAELTSFGQELKMIFDYESYRSSQICMDVLKSLEFEKSRPCPYCNIDTIEIIKYDHETTAEEKEKALLDLDHFSARCRFPFLALSFYNLIPSCTKCNQNFKSQLDFRITNHVNPYEIAFDDYFEFSTSIPLIVNMETTKFNIVYKKKSVSGQEFPENSIKDLKLIERLETKKEDVMRFFNAISRFNNGKNTVNELAKKTDTVEYNINDALMDFGVTNNRNDIHRKELTKVYRDIFKNIS